MHEIERHVLVPLPTLLGVDFSITNEVLLLWLAAAVTFVLLAAGCRRRGPVAHGWFPNLFEALIDLVEREIILGSVGKKAGLLAPFLLACSSSSCSATCWEWSRCPRTSRP